MDDASSPMVRSVLITGGSSGIGFELSKWFAQDGYRILWVALETDELEQSKAELVHLHPELELHYLAADLSQPDAPGLIFKWVYEQVNQLDILINNAGIGTYGDFEKNDRQADLRMIQINVNAVYELTHRFIPAMEQAGGGRIVNISSAASYLPLPYMGVYAATKAFVRQLSESLSWELQARGSSVKVTVVCPSAIGNTQFQKAAGMDGVRTFTSPLARTTVEEVARDTYRGIKSGRELIRTGLRFRINYWVSRFTPRFLARRILAWEMKRTD